ncbi:TPA: M48 family peptidase [Candidatus Wolfebacteria bacterium]|nr:MAG: putative metal-dependent hydrolase [Candidatus Wolfebacteria bacterium GW2011_GWB1_47_1]HAL24710.1 M48 family peptidase [Candidatus Wolfebacteria bacterium]HBD18274.1 M48 family peptidase [Candidatus Wolfebacteria bacterium]HBN86667.1 M48 family peptidase [Candidatus Wolfebacteria bacterium]HBT74642.1 M48 family peptidase [Candidatus Wolfebacteria bacterium]
MNQVRRTIILCDRPIDYDLKKNKRVKRMRFSVGPGGSLVVTIPYRFPEQLVERFMHEHAQWIITQIERFRQQGGRLSRYGRDHYLEHKEAARQLAHERLAHFNQFYDFDYGDISIRDQKTRWGSCSRAGNLNFNYKLAVVPEHIADYVIVHELCHCKEFNHSPRFWKLVEQTIPNHKEIRKQLRSF